MSYFMQFLFVMLLVVFGSIKVTLQGRMSRHHIRSTQDSIFFNALLFLAIAAFLALLFPMGRIDGTCVLFAALAGLCMAAFQTGYAIALNCGPVSLTVMIVNFNVLLTVAFSMAVFGEKLYATQLMGIGFLVLSLVLNARVQPGEKKATAHWLGVVFLTSVTSGASNCIQKVYMTSPAGLRPNADATFLFVLYLISSALAFAAYVFNTRIRHAGKTTMRLRSPVAVYVLVISLVLSVYQKLYMNALSIIDGSFLFPTYAGATALMMSLIGVLFFKDRLNRRQQLSVACGVACIVLMNVRAGFTL